MKNKPLAKYGLVGAVLLVLYGLSKIYPNFVWMLVAGCVLLLPAAVWFWDDKDHRRIGPYEGYNNDL